MLYFSKKVNVTMNTCFLNIVAHQFLLMDLGNLRIKYLKHSIGSRKE